MKGKTMGWQTLLTVGLGIFGLTEITMADVQAIKGSDTLAGVMISAISEADMGQEISYLGGGSGKGENALIAGEQGIAPMSREMKPEVLAEGRAHGVLPVGHVIGLDGIAVFLNGANAVSGLSLDVVKKIFLCDITSWSQVPNSGLSGTIKVVRRDDNSGTTDTFKHLVGISTFGACVAILPETADIAHETAHNSLAIGYSGLSAAREGNRAAALSRAIGEAFVLPTVANIRSGAYPLARKLFVYEAAGTQVPNAAEAEFLTYLLDRSFLDPILQANGFFTLN
jgi:phosphate transport system substrate-binding protein